VKRRIAETAHCEDKSNMLRAKRRDLRRNNGLAKGGDEVAGKE
jgi:hypothetical protein